MSTIDQIDIFKPVIIDAFIKNVQYPELGILLEGADATLFWRWVKFYWREDFERDLQSLCEHDKFGPLLTACVDLTDFREKHCERDLRDTESVGLPDLLAAILKQTSTWASVGIDSVLISGCCLEVH